MATKNVCTISRQPLQRRSNDSTITPTPTWAMKLASTRAVSGVSFQDHTCIAADGAM